jgi:putative transcriptional regulator
MTIKFVILTMIISINKEEKSMALENRLKEYRAINNLNQSALGKLVGASRQTISLIERGDYSPSVVLALKIAKVFNTTVEAVFLFEEEEEEKQL